MSVEGSSSNISIEQKRLALIVGQTDYQFLGKLPSAVLDSMLMEKTLKNISFTATVLTDKTIEEIEDELNQFRKKIRQGDVVFFYFSGHAAQQTIKHETDNYLFGVDSKRETENGENIIKGIALQRKIFYRYFIQNSIYLVVLDACRKYPNNNEKIKAVDLGPMTLSMDCLPEDIKRRQFDVVFACQPGCSAYEPQKGVGYLATALNKALSKPGSWAEAQDEIIQQVLKDTNNRQYPSISKNIGVQILIKPKITHLILTLTPTPEHPSKKYQAGFPQQGGYSLPQKINERQSNEDSEKLDLISLLGKTKSKKLRKIYEQLQRVRISKKENKREVQLEETSIKNKD
eukprot:TRINITY_DN4374_c0_g1_i1.p1 TRINITY_DN4374_c0_g1~~TRINITY_DN4374_c0_g1_i1.p1  ORF type:complete len:345 (+),score=33.28 TRINITY_DN4374_c0_g1_i1:96-1130(+)